MMKRQSHPQRRSLQIYVLQKSPDEVVARDWPALFPIGPIGRLLNFLLLASMDASPRDALFGCEIEV